MPKEEKVELEGEVVEALPNAMFRVKLDNMDRVVLGHVAGKMRRFRIRILPGDRVRVELSPVRPRSRADRLPPPVAPAGARRGAMRELELIADAAIGLLRRRRIRAWSAGSATTPRSSAARGYAVTSVDTMVDGVHFRSSAADRGGDRPPRARRRAVGPRRDGRRRRARPTWRSACRRAPTLGAALALLGGAQALARALRRDDRRRRRDPRPGADRLVHRRRLGRLTPASSSAATAPARATWSASPARSAAAGAGLALLEGRATLGRPRAAPSAARRATPGRSRAWPRAARWRWPAPAR